MGRINPYFVSFFLHQSFIKILQERLSFPFKVLQFDIEIFSHQV